MGTSDVVIAVIAGYAALVSTITAIYNWRKDRVQIGMTVGTVEDGSGAVSMKVTVVNEARRPLYYTFAGFRTPPGSTTIQTYPFEALVVEDEAVSPAQPGQPVDYTLSPSELQWSVSRGMDWLEITTSVGAHQQQIPEWVIDRVAGGRDAIRKATDSQGSGSPDGSI